MSQENEYAPVEKAQTLLREANELITQAQNAEETDASGCLDRAAEKCACAKSAIEGIMVIEVGTQTETLGNPKLMSMIEECGDKIVDCRANAAANSTA